VSCSVLLRAKLPSPNESDEPGSDTSNSHAGLPVATVEIVASLIAVAAGVGEYYYSMEDMRNKRAFLVASK
jgi:hypothetical protein